VTAEISTTGASLTSTPDNIVYTFPPNTFTAPVVFTHTIRFQSDCPSTGQLQPVDRFYEASAAVSGSGLPTQPTGPYTVTIQYTDLAEGPVQESTLALYVWDGSAWVKEPSSVVVPDANTVVARPTHLSLWAVLGDAHRVFLPSIRRQAP
jgi:hypothetical protein